MINALFNEYMFCRSYGINQNSSIISAVRQILPKKSEPSLKQYYADLLLYTIISNNASNFKLDWNLIIIPTGD